MMLTMTLIHAETPLWTFAPLTATAITLPANSTATVMYRITNQSKKSHTLVMRPIHGVTQVTTPGNCSNQFTLNYLQSCILNLTIDGSAVHKKTRKGPVVCDQGNSNQCYRPSKAHRLKITHVPAANYTVGGSTFGLSGTLVLANNGDDALTMNADQTFTFSNALPPGSSYSVTVQSQPATQTCTVSNGNGTITNANVTNVTVTCSTNTFTIGGTVSGLTVTETVVLQNNGGDNLIINSNGSFTFSSPVAQDATYNVSVLTQPTTQVCTVNNNSGTVGTSNITNVQVTCSTNAYTVGGNVSGLSGTVVLQNNGMDDLSLNSNVPFTFPTPVAQGASYNVTVLSQPATQTCTVSNSSGTMGGSNVTNVSVNCVINTVILSPSVSNLALSVTGLTEYGVPGTPSSGLARIITITNTGSDPAINLTITPPTWPSGTTNTTTCSSTLAAGDTCTITVTPGNTATSDGTNPCSGGTAPAPGVIQVAADSASTVSINVAVLSYACIYQGGYVYAFDDTTLNTGSVGGKVATTTDQAPGGVIWSSNGAGGGSADTVFDIIFGISEISTTSSPDPSSDQVPGQIACEGSFDGACNTNNIYVYYENYAAGAPINLSYYSAGVCKKTIDGYSDWYLPALCEMSNDAADCSNGSTPALQNIVDSLFYFNNLYLLNSTYRCSTASSSDTDVRAWLVIFNASVGSTGSGRNSKDIPLNVRCSRALTV